MHMEIHKTNIFRYYYWLFVNNYYFVVCFYSYNYQKMVDDSQKRRSIF